MEHNWSVSSRQLLWLAVVLVLGGRPAPGSTADHPTLVDPAATSCATCHSEVLRVRVPHAPAVDDCLICHTFGRSGDQTTVAVKDEGAALCLSCHDGMVEAATGKLAAPHAPAVDTCDSCHDPHGTDSPALLVVEPGSLCRQCHDPDATDAQHPIPVQRGDCGSCHQAHGSDREHMLRGVSQHLPFSEGSCDACHRTPRGTRIQLLDEGGRLCAACHGDVTGGPDAVGQHTALRQGRCVACHDPHVADRPKLLRAEGGDLCFPCHSEIAAVASGPGAHPVLEQGCDGCHDPHSSARRDLLVDDADRLCRSCHDAAGPDLARRHFAADMTTARCGSCHDPHGSRIKPLIAAGSVHQPFREGCSNCHEGSARALQEDGNALCEGCHEDVAEAAATAAVPHPAMEAAECVDCHSPHAARQPALLRSSGGRLCLPCHEAQGGQPGETVHGAVAWIGCQGCHVPHGGANEKLLRALGNELCAGCHLRDAVRFDADGTAHLGDGFELRADRARSLGIVDLDPSGRRGHPTPDHPVSGLITGEGRVGIAPSLVGRELSCGMCHEPHAAPSPQLLSWQATTQAELCIACHPK